MSHLEDEDELMHLGEPVDLSTPQMRKAMEDLKKGYNIVDLSHTITFRDVEDWLGPKAEWAIEELPGEDLKLILTTSLTAEELEFSNADVKMLLVSRLELTHQQLDQILTALREKVKK